MLAIIINKQSARQPDQPLLSKFLLPTILIPYIFLSVEEVVKNLSFIVIQIMAL